MTNKDKTFAIGAIVFIILIAIISNHNSNKETPVTTSTNTPDKYDAYVMMEKFVKDKLKAPSTAEFESISTISMKQEGNIWAFDGYVDSQNSFGAMLRTKFTVSIRYNPDKDNWSLLNLFFNE